MQLEAVGVIQPQKHGPFQIRLKFGKQAYCVMEVPGRSLTAASFEGDLSTYYLSLANARYFVAKLVAPEDALCKSLLPELYEPVLTSIGNRPMVLRGFEKEGGAVTVQEWLCEMRMSS